MAQQMQMQTPQDLFVHELSDMLSAEQLIARMLSDAMELAQQQHLQQVATMHQQQTEQHVRNVQEALERLNVAPHSVQSHAVQGLQQELMEVAQSQPCPRCSTARSPVARPRPSTTRSRPTRP